MGNKIRDLKAGTSGLDVKAVQRTLKDWGAAPIDMSETGQFHGETERAVSIFQEKYQLKTDGIVGPVTRRALYPVGVTTVTLVGMRLKKPELMGRPGSIAPSLLRNRLTLDAMPQIRSKLLNTRSDYELTKLPRIPYAIPAPKSPNILFPIPPLNSSDSDISCGFGFIYGHKEVQPGTQTMIPFGGKIQNAFTLTVQTVCLLGPDDGKHLEMVPFGWQAAAPITSLDSGWTISPFVQVTDVDRFGALGHFHWWQPYGQVGAQFGGPPGSATQLTANLVPVNLTLDLSDTISVNASAGMAFNLNLSNGQLVVGPVLTTGLTIKWDFPAAMGQTNDSRPSPSLFNPMRLPSW